MFLQIGSHQLFYYNRFLEFLGILLSVSLFDNVYILLPSSSLKNINKFFKALTGSNIRVNDYFGGRFPSALRVADRVLDELLEARTRNKCFIIFILRVDPH